MKSNRLGTFYGVGVGPGDPSMLTLKAVDVLKKVDIIFQAVGERSKESVSARIIDSIDGCCNNRKDLVFSMAKKTNDRKEMWVKNAKEVAFELKSGKSVAFVTIGDPLIYSTFIYLMREVKKIIPDINVETIPGITSFQYSASRVNMPLVEDKEIFSIVPSWDEENVDMTLVEHSDTVVFLKSYRTKNELLSQLQKRGMKSGIYAERVGLEDEKIISCFDSAQKLSNEYLSHIIVRRNG